MHILLQENKVINNSSSSSSNSTTIITQESWKKIPNAHRYQKWIGFQLMHSHTHTHARIHACNATIYALCITIDKNVRAASFVVPFILFASFSLSHHLNYSFALLVSSCALSPLFNSLVYKTLWMWAQCMCKLAIAMWPLSHFLSTCVCMCVWIHFILLLRYRVCA